ncbi:MAG: glycosyltransferase family 4 protein [Tannerella sp.]|jgi:glycosyltransferase involved in cell wall biosynthesis|nr:glycosyltransferase family 4 protein [Tannerella sp.]
MKIGFDAKRTVRNNTGLGNHNRQVIEVLSEYYPDNEYLLFAPRQKENSRLRRILEKANVTFFSPGGFFKLFPSVWRSWGILRDIGRQGLAVFHGLSNELPVGIKKAGIKTVVTIHDLIFLRYPEYYRLVDRTVYRLKFHYACKKADRIIAVSECTKRDIISFFHIPEDRISVVYQGCHSGFRAKVSEEKKSEIADRYRLPRRFVLYVGSIEARKNLLLAVKALRQIPEEIHLVAVGKSTPYQSAVEKYAGTSGVKPRLHILNQAQWDDLPAIYQSAALFVYPSFFEGFGIPIVEALNSGIPVIAATGSCLEEAGGPASVYVSPHDGNALAGEIMRILNNKGLAEKMIEAGKCHAERFSEKSIAENIMNVYESCISRGGGRSGFPISDLSKRKIK